MLDILRNYKLKILAVVLGAGTWFIINQQIISKEENFFLSLKVKAAEDMVVTNLSSKSVRVSVRGPAEEIAKFDPRLFPVEIDLTRQNTALEKEVILDHDKLQKSIPPQLKILDHLPSHVVVSIDRKKTVNLPVEVSIVGKPQYGFRLFDATARPKFSKYEAAAGALETIESIKTEEIDISSISGKFSKNVALIDPLTGKTLPQEVMAIITIQPEYRDRLFKNVPIKLMLDNSLNKKIVLAPEAIDIMVEGRADEIEKMEPKEILLHIAVTPEMDGHYQLHPSALISNKYQTVKIRSNLPTIEVDVGPSI